MDSHATASLAGTLIASYLLGSIPSGYLIGCAHGIDIRKHGSGNIGATNITRTLGKKWGRLCFACDFMKGLLPVLLVRIILSKSLLEDPFCLLPAVAAFGAVAGHVWTVFLGFKGGKGVSTAAGALIAVNAPAVLAAAAVWTIAFFAFRYVSLASILAALSLPFASFLFSILKIWTASLPDISLMGVLALLTVFKHTQNIRRLINGTESRFTKKNDEDTSNGSK